MNKATVRAIYKDKRMQLTENERNKLDDLILIQFQRMNYNDINVLLNYIPMEKMKEPNSLALEQYLNFLLPHLQICQPKVDPDKKSFSAYLINDQTEFEYNSFGTLEPHSHHKVDPQDIDIIFVPLLAIDKSGHRVGYGKGMYDQFLSQCREDIVTIGISYFDPIEEIIDSEAHDIPLMFCITPNDIFKF